MLLGGSGADIAAFRVAHRSGGTPLSFERLLPTPPEVLDAPRQEGHFPEWRVWRTEHWGTKWDAVSPELTDDGSALTFLTAWTPPTMWLAAASAASPRVELVHEFVEEFCHFSGRDRWRAGECVETREVDPSELEWVEFEPAEQD
jgi:hypothetical protein